MMCYNECSIVSNSTSDYYMNYEALSNPALTIALALVFGVMAQLVARHLKIPGIVLLLLTGIISGPDFLNIIQPDSTGKAIHILVGFAVAIILFEGGMNLNWKRLKNEATIIRQLISLGTAVTVVGGALSAKLLLHWSWGISILFGTLVIVTGPTVVTPLLRRIRITHKIETILEAEGVFIDAVGAITAIVALEIYVGGNHDSLLINIAAVPWRLTMGIIFGIAGGLLIVGMLKLKGLISEGLENIFTLSMVLAIYQLSNSTVEETGIAAVITAGLVVGNIKSPAKKELVEFKEQLTILFIGMLFVLLAADVRIEDVKLLGIPGALTALSLMFVVRPIGIMLCSRGSKLSIKEKLFLSWLAPRGIVAAAIASLFYERMTLYNMSGGRELRAMVFLVIAITVVFQGLSGGFFAGILGLRRERGRGYVILGAQELNKAIGHIFLQAGELVTMIDANPETCEEAEKEGFKVIYGNALEERVMLMAELDTRKALLALIPNTSTNLIFVKKARQEFKLDNAFVAVQAGIGAANMDMINEAGARILFGNSTDIILWSVRIRRNKAVVEKWVMTNLENYSDRESEIPAELQSDLLPLVCSRKNKLSPFSSLKNIKEEDIVYWIVFSEKSDAAEEWLKTQGWNKVTAKLA